MTYRNKRVALEAYVKEMESYKGYVGCDPEYTKYVYIIQKRINEGKTPGYNTFSAEGNSRKYFFSHVSRWLINLVHDNQDYWHNNENFTNMFELLATCQKLACTNYAHSEIDVNQTILELADYICNE